MDPCLGSAFPSSPSPVYINVSHLFENFHVASSTQAHHAIMIKMPQNISADKNVKNLCTKPLSFHKAVS